MCVYQGISDCCCRACPVFSQLFLLLLLFQRMSRKPKREHVKSTLSTCMSGMLLSENYMQCIYFTVSVYIPKKINIFSLTERFIAVNRENMFKDLCHYGTAVYTRYFTKEIYQNTSI